MAQIHELMGKILAECPSIGKDDRNQAQQFNFRGIDAVLDNLNPVMARHGVFCLPTVLTFNPDSRITGNNKAQWVVYVEVRYDFYAPDGSSVAAVVWGEGTDSGDKSCSKALTMAQKSALVQAFSIATRELDPDSTAEESKPAPKRVPPKKEEKPSATPAADPEHAARKAALDALVQAALKAGFPDTEKETRKDVAVAAVGKGDIKEMSLAEVMKVTATFEAIASNQLELGYSEDGSTPILKTRAS